ncbi:MAG TPA: type II toxin-antitoxin system RelE/ParE family toxin [Stellaceae bacterium]|nr:type II toxin-antitoxin system RelE/ParE family toxin [Stellaceae bacterium]
MIAGAHGAEYTRMMVWDVEYTDEFGEWWSALTESQQDRVAATVRLLAARGPSLPFPYSSGVQGSRHEHMRELRVQSRGNPLRIFYAFDPRRTAILLIGGDKTGDDRFYERHVPLADALSDTYLEELRKEGLV